MLRTDLPDYRRVSEGDLVAALRKRDPLALAEAYHRTIPAAHATARRMLSASSDVEALLRAVYDELWRNPPVGAGLEGWIRSRTFDLGLEHLRRTESAPASPSLATLLPELPRPDVRYLDAAERALAELDDRQRTALLTAHDRGVPTDRQDDEAAASALLSALFALAGPEPGGESADGECNVSGVADWVLGLLPANRADEVAAAVASSPGCENVVKALRRGRRRLEGLPPTPDMGQRILVVVLAGAPAPSGSAPSATGLRSALDADDDVQGRLAPLGLASEQDTGDLGAQEEMAAEGVGSGDVTVALARNNDDGGDATAAYAELAALDEQRDDDDPLLAGDDDGDAGYERSRGGRRALLVFLSILIIAVGIAAGLAIGYLLVPRFFPA